MKPIEIPGFEHYLINEKGEIYSTLTTRQGKLEVPKLKKCYPNKNNRYVQVILVNVPKGIKPKLLYVHRLVAQHFIPNPNNLPEVNHRDFDRSNNCVENLEWVTRRENMEHAQTNTNIRNSKFRRLLLQEELVQQGIEHYKTNQNINYLLENWKVCATLCFDMLRYFNVEIKKGRKRKHKLDLSKYL